MGYYTEDKNINIPEYFNIEYSLAYFALQIPLSSEKYDYFITIYFCFN